MGGSSRSEPVGISNRINTGGQMFEWARLQRINVEGQMFGWARLQRINVEGQMFGWTRLRACLTLALIPVLATCGQGRGEGARR